jgi:hypothetical protein
MKLAIEILEKSIAVRVVDNKLFPKGPHYSRIEAEIASIQKLLEVVAKTKALMLFTQEGMINEDRHTKALLTDLQKLLKE